MKVKCRPEDFRVEEKLKLRLTKRGPYSVYRLEKKHWNTLDVIRDLERRHHLPRISRAGLKDRHSLSIQYLSIRGKGPSNITETNYKLRLAGMAYEPVTRDQLLGNRFNIVLRALPDKEVDAVRAALPLVTRFGVPNYYDDQRFGSARHGQGFVARKLIDRHYNGALKLFLATPCAADDSRTRRTRKLLRENWRDWRSCLRLAPTEAKDALKHLAFRPSDFKGAVQLLPRPLLELFINAYQAYFWNQIMAEVLTRLKVRTRQLGYSVGTFLFYEELAPKQHRYLKKLIIPAPGPGARFTSDRVASITDSVLAREGLELTGLKLQLRMHGLFFKPYERKALVSPSGLNLSSPEPDDLYPGRKKLRLSFFLPSGSYATIIIKRLVL